MHDRRQNLLPRQAAQRHVLSHLRPDAGQRMGERDHVLVFATFADLAERRVIPILLAPLSVPPRGLDVTIGGPAYPHLSPRWRNDNRAYASQHLSVGDRGTVRMEIAKTATRLAPANSRLLHRDIAKS